MGTYDTFTNEDGQLSVQVKCGPCEMECYVVGDDVGDFYSDGAIVAPEGCVVVKGGRVESVTEDLPPDVRAGKVRCQDKWGGAFDPSTETPKSLGEAMRRQFQEWAATVKVSDET